MKYTLAIICILAFQISACSQADQSTASVATQSQSDIGKDSRDMNDTFETTTVWTGTYSSDVAYINRTDKAISVMSAPSTDADSIGTLKPGMGNFLLECTTDLEWCSMNYKGTKDTGWVNMKHLLGQGG